MLARLCWRAPGHLLRQGRRRRRQEGGACGSEQAGRGAPPPHAAPPRFCHCRSAMASPLARTECPMTPSGHTGPGSRWPPRRRPGRRSRRGRRCCRRSRAVRLQLPPSCRVHATPPPRNSSNVCKSPIQDQLVPRTLTRCAHGGQAGCPGAAAPAASLARRTGAANGPGPRGTAPWERRPAMLAPDAATRWAAEGPAAGEAMTQTLPAGTWDSWRTWCAGSGHGRMRVGVAQLRRRHVPVRAARQCGVRATCAGSPSRIASDPTSLHTRTHRCLALMR